MKIAVIDYDAGNVRSVQRALQAAGGPNAEVEITGDPQKIQEAQAVVFPGQGAAGQCMSNLTGRNLAEIIYKRIESGRPFMGVCVGLQLMFGHLEEDNTTGLNIFPGEVRRFPARRGYKVPQIGWNAVRQTKDSLLWQGVPDNAYFYFVHSYYTDPAPEISSYVAGVTDYGFDFACAFEYKNCFGTQFHPEKSGKLGLQVYANYLQYAAQV